MASSLPPGIDPAKLPSMAPPSGFASNFVNPVTLADTIIAVSATTSILAVALLSMRLYSTLGITRSASGDDAASVLAMVFSLAYTGLIVNTRDNARHGWDLPISAFTAGYFKIILSETIIAALGLLFSKLSILLLLFRLFSPTQTFRYLVYTAIVWATLISSVTIVVASALCTPRSGESFGSLTVVERCSHQQTWAVVQGALNMPLDFYILYLPIPMVWKLQMRPKRKIGVTAIFMTGFIACIAGTLSLAYKVKLVQSSDKLWNAARVDILNIVELNVAIMVACMPACVAFFRYCFNKFEIVSSIKSRLLSSRSGKAKSSQSKQKATTSNLSPVPEGDPVGTGKYWRLKGPLFNARDGTPPQITSNKQSSRVLQTGDFKVFDDDKRWPLSAKIKGSRSIELKETSFEKEQALATTPDHGV